MCVQIDHYTLHNTAAIDVELMDNYIYIGKLINRMIGADITSILIA